MTTTEEALAGARRHAKSAALRDVGLKGCPYPADGTPVQNAARVAWVREYSRRRPPVIDFSSDLDAMAAGDGDEQDQQGADQAAQEGEA